MKTRKLRSTDESGMASFLVVTLIVTLLALVSIGFSHLADREARQALDRQLSDAAYYAAESGLNDAFNYVSNNPSAGNINTCSLPSVSPNPFANNGYLSSDGVIRYSCITITTKPNKLTYTLQPGQTVTFPITSDQLDNLYFSWENQCYPPNPDPGGPPSCTGTKGPLTNVFGQLPQEVSPNLDTDATGLLRVGIYPVPTLNLSGDTNSDISSVSKVYFLYPNSGSGQAGTVDYTNDPGGTMVDGRCKDTHVPNVLPDAPPLFCNVEVTGLNNALNNAAPAKNRGVSSFYISLTAKYQPLTVLIQAETKDADHNADNCDPNDHKLLCISGTEAVIDSTGAGNDVLRRVRAVTPLQLNNPPSFGLQSMQGVCKLFRVPVPTQNNYGTPQNDNSAPNPDGMCLYPSFSSGTIGG